MRTKRITLSISDNIDAIKKQIEEEHGVEYSYNQVVNILIHYYRKSKKPQTSWQNTGAKA